MTASAASDPKPKLSDQGFYLMWEALEQAIDDFGHGHCVCEATKQQCIEALAAASDYPFGAGVEGSSPAPVEPVA